MPSHSNQKQFFCAYRCLQCLSITTETKVDNNLMQTQTSMNGSGSASLAVLPDFTCFAPRVQTNIPPHAACQSSILAAIKTSSRDANVYSSNRRQQSTHVTWPKPVRPGSPQLHLLHASTMAFKTRNSRNNPCHGWDSSIKTVKTAFAPSAGPQHVLMPCPTGWKAFKHSSFFSQIIMIITHTVDNDTCRSPAGCKGHLQEEAKACTVKSLQGATQGDGSNHSQGVAQKVLMCFQTIHGKYLRPFLATAD